MSDFFANAAFTLAPAPAGLDPLLPIRRSFGEDDVPARPARRPGRARRSPRPARRGSRRAPAA